jgi:hypothetical protein
VCQNGITRRGNCQRNVTDYLPKVTDIVMVLTHRYHVSGTMNLSKGKDGLIALIFSSGINSNI